METPAETEAEYPSRALALLRDHPLIALAWSDELPSIVGAVVGGPVRGSWWGHPKGAEIYALSVALSEAPGVLATKLVGGKVTFVHERLWPALLRVVTDPDFRRARERSLSGAARGLLARVASRGELRLDQERGRDRKETSRIKAELEESLLVVSSSVHTEKGSHATVLTSWERWAPDAAKEAAAALTLERAEEALRAAGAGSALERAKKPRKARPRA
jgi:hypothetical protein